MDDLPEASDIDEVREKNREAVVRLVAVDLEENRLKDRWCKRCW